MSAEQANEVPKVQVPRIRSPKLISINFKFGNRTLCLTCHDNLRIKDAFNSANRVFKIQYGLRKLVFKINGLPIDQWATISHYTQRLQKYDHTIEIDIQNLYRRIINKLDRTFTSDELFVLNKLLENKVFEKKTNEDIGEDVKSDQMEDKDIDILIYNIHND